jgi:hypothetical protein
MAAHYHRAHTEALRIISHTTEPRATSPLIPRGGIENLDTLTTPSSDAGGAGRRNDARASKSKR